MIARRLGYRVMLLERGRHPRFAIGESASPLAGILIEQLCDRYDLPRLRPLSAFGTWQRAYPDVVCGLKRGFTYFRHERGLPYRRAAGSIRSSSSSPPARATSCPIRTGFAPTSIISFMREAVALGVEYLDELELRSLRAARRLFAADAATDAAPRLHPRAIRHRRAADRTGSSAARLNIRNSGLRRIPANAGAVLTLHRCRALRDDD